MFVPTKFLPNPHDPFEGLALRWRRTEYLLAHHRQPSLTLDDASTHEAWRFLDALRRCRHDTDRERLAQRHPGINAAYQLFSQAGTLKQAEMEARLLARENDEAIAKKCQVPQPVVAAYHNLFFAVRPHLQAEVYILTQAIGPKAFGPLTLADRDVLLKLVGYCMGGLMVDQLLDYFANPPDCHADLALLDDTAFEILHTKLHVQAMLLSFVMPANAATVARLPAIRRLLAEASVLTKATAGTVNCALFEGHAALDHLAALSASETVEINFITPASAEGACVAEHGGFVIPCSRDWLGVSA